MNNALEPSVDFFKDNMHMLSDKFSELVKHFNIAILHVIPNLIQTPQQE